MRFFGEERIKEGEIENELREKKKIERVGDIVGNMELKI